MRGIATANVRSIAHAWCIARHRPRLIASLTSTPNADAHSAPIASNPRPRASSISDTERSLAHFRAIVSTSRVCSAAAAASCLLQPLRARARQPMSPGFVCTHFVSGRAQSRSASSVSLATLALVRAIVA